MKHGLLIIFPTSSLRQETGFWSSLLFLSHQGSVEMKAAAVCLFIILLLQTLAPQGTLGLWRPSGVVSSGRPPPPTAVILHSAFQLMELSTSPSLYLDLDLILSPNNSNLNLNSCLNLSRNQMKHSKYLAEN